MTSFGPLSGVRARGCTAPDRVPSVRKMPPLSRAPSDWVLGPSGQAFSAAWCVARLDGLCLVCSPLTPHATITVWEVLAANLHLWSWRGPGKTRVRLLCDPRRRCRACRGLPRLTNLSCRTQNNGARFGTRFGPAQSPSGIANAQWRLASDNQPGHTRTTAPGPRGMVEGANEGRSRATCQDTERDCPGRACMWSASALHRGEPTEAAGFGAPNRDSRNRA
jgi:hypothetical protein